MNLPPAEVRIVRRGEFVYRVTFEDMTYRDVNTGSIRSLGYVGVTVAMGPRGVADRHSITTCTPRQGQRSAAAVVEAWARLGLIPA